MNPITEIRAQIYRDIKALNQLLEKAMREDRIRLRGKIEGLNLALDRINQVAPPRPYVTTSQAGTVSAWNLSDTPFGEYAFALNTLEGGLGPRFWNFRTKEWVTSPVKVEEPDFHASEAEAFELLETITP